MQPSPIVSLNRAVALAQVEGPGPALAVINELIAGGELDNYHLLHATRADLLRRLGSFAEAAKSYARGLELAANESERRFLERRLHEVQSADGATA
jgi:RNA polymerase sigma-70 factor (ECF subfamily)